MNKTNRQIEWGDKVEAILSKGGKVLARLCFDRFSSMADIIKMLKTMAVGVSGLTQLVVKNLTRGWCYSDPLYLRSSSLLSISSLTTSRTF